MTGDAGARAGLGPKDASMTLLVEILDRPLDPGYVAAGERRVAAGLPRSTGTRTPLLVVAALVVGFVLAVSAVALRPPGTSASREKEQLIEQVQVRQEDGDARAAAISDLRAEIKAYQDRSLAQRSAGLAAQLTALELATGASAATGPGLTITLDDAASAGVAGSDPRSDGSTTSGTDAGRVTALDLQVVTNGLWQAGAEAQSVNGQRLTARSAIRVAGQAVLVDFRPLTPPYVVTAIGDSATLPGAFAQTVAGSYLTALRDNYQIPSTISPSARLTVPAAASLDVSAGTTSGTTSGAMSTSTSATATP